MTLTSCRRLREQLADPALLREAAYLAGGWVDPDNRAGITVTDPADGTILGSVPALTRADAERAVDIADAAFPAWAGLSPGDRADLLAAWHQLILDHAEDLALIMTYEQGKPISEARGEISYGAGFVGYYAKEARDLNGVLPAPSFDGVAIDVWREPVGVAALITPWNFPSAMLTRKAAAALAAGCTFVACPSAETPFSALAVTELAHRAGFPAGVFNVVTGHAPDLVPAWTDELRVRALSFTGSTEVGRLLFRQSAETVKTIAMELGGHAPFLVFDDANLDHAVDCAISAKFATSGQDCLAVNRFLIHASIYEAFCQRFTERVAALSVGPGIDDPDIGPLINRKAMDKQATHVADALAKGARCLVGGGPHPAGDLFFAPTVLVDVPANARILHEETFGPVAAFTPFSDEDEAVRRANASEYGLIAYLHTQDEDRIDRITRALQYGMLAINRTEITGAEIPFGGVKQSGIGREGTRLGMEAFTEIKYVCKRAS
ncbi:MAG: NAD-dependent succinate-semialdehyde dehydrogenase [Pseudomonadota bacterium]